MCVIFFSLPGTNWKQPSPSLPFGPSYNHAPRFPNFPTFFREEEEEEVARYSTLTWHGRTTGPLVLLLRTRSNGLAGAKMARLREPFGLCGVVGAWRYGGGAVPFRSQRRRPGPGGGQWPDAPTGAGQAGVVLRRHLRQHLCKLAQQPQIPLVWPF